jgi:hypothetical protein
MFAKRSRDYIFLEWKGFRGNSYCVISYLKQFPGKGRMNFYGLIADVYRQNNKLHTFSNI